MKIAISHIAWSKEENDSITSILKKHEIHGIEAAPTKCFDDPERTAKNSVKKVRHYWNNRGIDIVAMQSLTYGKNFELFGSDQQRDEMFEYLKKMIGIGATLGAKPLVFGSPKHRQRKGRSMMEAFDIAVPFFRQVGEYAYKHGVTFCIEPNAKAYECDFMNTTSEAIKLIELVDHPGFRLHLDTGVLTLEHEHIERSIEQALPYTKHVHISEPFLAHITERKTDHNKIAQLLRTFKYDKWVSIEMKENLMKPNIVSIEKAVVLAKEMYG